MNAASLQYWIAGTLCAGLFGFAFIAAPRSCEWGLPAYFFVGIAVVALLLGTPFVAAAIGEGTDPLWRRAVLALCFGLVGGGVWAAGFFAANFRIICRMI